MEEGASGKSSESQFIDSGLFSKTQRGTTKFKWCHSLMRFSAGKDYNNSSAVVESCEEDKAGVRESVQPSRAEGKVVFAKAETVGMRRAGAIS